MNNKHVRISVFYMLIIIFACKPKTELYLERGLDILSNKKEVSFNILNDITISEIGVIRDQKEGIKTLVFKLDYITTQEAFNNDNIIGVRVWIMDDNGAKRIEDWDFKPKPRLTISPAVALNEKLLHLPSTIMLLSCLRSLRQTQWPSR